MAGVETLMCVYSTSHPHLRPLSCIMASEPEFKMVFDGKPGTSQGLIDVITHVSE